MFERNDKRRIYWLVDQYLSREIDAPTFCSEFYYSYTLEINDNDLTESEQEIFSELDKITSRFSQFQEDLENYPGVYCSEEELKQKIIETNARLKDQNPV